MIIETQLTFKQYLKFRLGQLYRNLTIMFLLLIFGGNAILSIIFSPKDIQTLLICLLSGSIVIGLFVFRVYASTRAQFYSNKRLQGKTIYEFTEDKITLSGENFKSEFDWEGTYKIKELKNWIMIYQSKLLANIIPKADFGDKLDEFRQLVKSKPGVKRKLRG